MRKDPWGQFAEAPAEDESFDQFAAADSAAKPDYFGELQRRFARGDTAEQLSAFAKSNNQSIAPEELDAGIKARAAGRPVQFHQGGVTVTPPEHSLGERLYMGLGDVAQGIGDTLGIVGNPLNATINLIAGTDLSTDLGSTLREATGAPEPATAAERLVSSGTRGAISGVAFPGSPAAMALNAVGGAASGFAGEKMADAGYGLAPQLLASLAAGHATGGVTTVGRRFLPHTAEMPQRFPNMREPETVPPRDDAPPPGRMDGGSPPPPPRSPDHFAEAGEEGIQLTRGQAEQSFDVQNDENSLRVSATREGERARQFFNRQQQQIAGAVERLRGRFGPDAGNAADRGQQVKDAVAELRASGADGVRQLYRQAEELGGEGLKLNTRGIHDAATDVLIDEAVPDGVKRAVSQELARYGIIGTAEPINEAGITRVRLDDGSAVSFRGPVKQLTASNAEDLRKAVNRLYDPTRPNLSGQSIKPAIDDALGEAIETAASGEGRIGTAYQEARAAYQQQRQTFHAKDIIDNLVAVKKGTQTDVLLPERAIAQVIGTGAHGVSNLRKVKGLLLSSGTDSARQAWAAIQHQVIAGIFDSAISRNVNHGSGQIGDVVSGAKLNSAIDNFGIDKLREALGPEDFNGLMKLRRIIGVATIPISGTTNPSGTATKIINYLRQGTLRFAGALPGVGHGVNAFAGLAAKGKEIAATRKTLEGIESYQGPDHGRQIDEAAREFVRAYVDSGTAGSFVPTAINLKEDRK